MKKKRCSRTAIVIAIEFFHVDCIVLWHIRDATNVHNETNETNKYNWRSELILLMKDGDDYKRHFGALNCFTFTI